MLPYLYFNFDLNTTSLLYAFKRRTIFTLPLHFICMLPSPRRKEDVRAAALPPFFSVHWSWRFHSIAVWFFRGVLDIPISVPVPLTQAQAALPNVWWALSLETRTVRSPPAELVSTPDCSALQLFLALWIALGFFLFLMRKSCSFTPITLSSNAIFGTFWGIFCIPCCVYCKFST